MALKLEWMEETTGCFLEDAPKMLELCRCIEVTEMCASAAVDAEL